MTMLPEYPSDPIAYLVRRKFGDAELAGPVSGLLEDEEETQTLLYAEIQTYRTELQGLEDEQLFVLVYQEGEKEARELREQEEQTPFFNQREAKADYEYWSRLPLWTLDEAVALTLEKSPAVVTWPRIEEFAESSPFAARFANLRRFVHRAKEAQQLTDPVPPAVYIAWAKANSVPLLLKLEKSVQAFSGEVPDWKALYEEEKLRHASTRDELERLKGADKPLGEKERRTFYRILLAAAIGGWGYDYRASKGSAAGEIAEESMRLRISVNEDTVHKKLKAATEEYGHQLPDDTYKQR